MLLEENREELTVQLKDILSELKQTNEELQEIKKVIGYINKYYDDCGSKYITLKISNNQSD